MTRSHLYALYEEEDHKRWDNLQHMLDPCNPMDYFWEELRSDWFGLCFKLKCDPAC